jgi:hypothetical protein
MEWHVLQVYLKRRGMGRGMRSDWGSPLSKQVMVKIAMDFLGVSGFCLKICFNSRKSGGRSPDLAFPTLVKRLTTQAEVI